jgi:hypothetical protein
MAATRSELPMEEAPLTTTAVGFAVVALLGGVKLAEGLEVATAATVDGHGTVTVSKMTVGMTVVTEVEMVLTETVGQLETGAAVAVDLVLAGAEVFMNLVADWDSLISLI